METIESIAEKAGISTRMVRRRAGTLGIPKHYKGEPGSQLRVFNDEQAAEIIAFKGEKRGRKPLNKEGEKC